MFKDTLTKAGRLEHVPSHGWPQAWVTHCEPAGSDSEVIASLAPDSRRIARTNNRIDTLEDGNVTFRFKDGTTNEWQRRPLPADAFIHRFLPHGLPKGFIKVRYDGFLSPSCRQSLVQIRTLLEAGPSTDPAAGNSPHRAWPQTHAALEEERRCRHCGGQLVLLGLLSPNTRGPPS
jgi:hypothetical protein